MGNECVEVGMEREEDIHYTHFFAFKLLNYVKISSIQKEKGRKERKKEGRKEG